MFAGFWALVVAMTLLAIPFVAAPLFHGKNRFRPAGIAVALPLFSVGLYLYVGSPAAAGVGPAPHQSMQTRVQVPASGKKPAGSVASMVDGLAARLRENPEDGKSWLLLARSYKHLQRMPEAMRAYERAAALGEHDAALAALSEPTAPVNSPAQIAGKVELSERSKDIVLPTDTVFVFARAVGGPPMPVAVMQRPASELPLDFVLDDRQALSADAKLSNFERVVVTARISRSGVATDALQQLEARSEEVVVADNRHLNLIIQ